MLQSISSIISSKAINILRFLFGFYSLIFLKVSSILFEYSIKAIESFKWFIPVLFLLLTSNWCLASYVSLAFKWFFSTSGCLLIRLNTEFVFPDKESVIINNV